MKSAMLPWNILWWSQKQLRHGLASCILPFHAYLLEREGFKLQKQFESSLKPALLEQVFCRERKEKMLLFTAARIHAEMRARTESAKYRIDARLEEAPAVFNCLTFVSWFFLQFFNREVEPLCEIVDSGMEVDIQNIAWRDLIFTAGSRSYYESANGSIGHVGIVTPHGTIIHATRRRGVNGIIEESLEEFLNHHGPLRTVRRLF